MLATLAVFFGVNKVSPTFTEPPTRRRLCWLGTNLLKLTWLAVVVLRVLELAAFAGPAPSATEGPLFTGESDSCFSGNVSPDDISMSMAGWPELPEF